MTDTNNTPDIISTKGMIVAKIGYQSFLIPINKVPAFLGIMSDTVAIDYIYVDDKRVDFVLDRQTPLEIGMPASTIFAHKPELKAEGSE
jgi:hypothetical protein